jgi:hypothetical protein
MKQQRKSKYFRSIIMRRFSRQYVLFATQGKFRGHLGQFPPFRGQVLKYKVTYDAGGNHVKISLAFQDLSISYRNHVEKQNLQL